MKKWTKLSIEYANQRSYLDDLFRIYPTIPDGIREINEQLWQEIEFAYQTKNNLVLIENLLKLDLFPIKDSYVAYLRRDPSALERNPKTLNRISGRLYEMGIEKIYERCSEPKETNRQIGPMFRNWLKTKALGIEPVDYNEFISNDEDAILDGNDGETRQFAKDKLNYHRNKGLDFVARFNGKYIIGEAKFLTDFGGHQNTQFEDAISTIEQKNVNAIQIAILDGVLYIESKSKMHKYISNPYNDYNIMSALLLRNFLYQI
ncbi:MAG: restriction endonuclease [Candidatus Zixiibacteriota bacterium]